MILLQPLRPASSTRKASNARAFTRFAPALATAALFVVSTARGALPASDNAGNYNGQGLPNYENGANAGFGLQPFNLFADNNSGNFLADYNPGGSAISTGGKVFNVYAQYGGLAGVSRGFTDNGGNNGGTLDIGQSVSFRLDLANTIIGDGGIGFTLESNNQQNVNFSVNGDNPGNTFGGAFGVLTGIRLDTLQGGVAFTVTVDAARQFTVMAQGVTDPTVTGSFTFTANKDLNLNGLTIYDYNAGPNNDLFFNDLSVSAVPEPATYLAGFGGAAVVLGASLRRRRSRPAAAV